MVCGACYDACHGSSHLREQELKGKGMEFNFRQNCLMPGVRERGTLILGLEGNYFSMFYNLVRQ